MIYIVIDSNNKVVMEVSDYSTAYNEAKRIKGEVFHNDKSSHTSSNFKLNGDMANEFNDSEESMEIGNNELGCF
jgi:hypothetical protein